MKSSREPPGKKKEIKLRSLDSKTYGSLLNDLKLTSGWQRSSNLHTRFSWLPKSTWGEQSIEDIPVFNCICVSVCIDVCWNAGGGATFSPTCTLYKPVLIIKLYFTISQTWAVYQQQGRRATFFALPKVSPVSTFCENCKSVNLIE